MSDFSAQIIARLDTSKIPNQLREIQEMVSKKSVSIPINTQEVQKQAQSLNQSIVNSFGESIAQAKTFKAEVNNAFSELLRTQNNITKLNKRLPLLDGEKNKQEISEIVKELDVLKKKYDSLFANYKSSFSKKQLGRIEEAVRASSSEVNRSKARASDRYDPYANAVKSLKSLYDLKKEYARLGSNKDTDFYYSKAIEKAESDYRTAKGKTSEPEYWDNSKRDELKRQEIAMEQQYQKELEKTAAVSSKLKGIKDSLARSGDNNSAFSVQIDKFEQDFQKYGLNVEQSKQKVQELRNALETLESSSDDELGNKFSKWQIELAKVRADLNQAKLSYDRLTQRASDDKITSTQIRLQKLLQNNSRATVEMRTNWQRYENELKNGVTEGRLKQINLELSKNELQLRQCGKWGQSFAQSFADLGKYAAGFISLQRAFDFVVQETRNAVNELEEVDTLLVEISKANDKLSDKDLTKIKEDSFGRASKYGKKSTDYLLGVQEMSRAGYSEAEDISELSLAVQGAGDVTAETANEYVIATDKAYKLKGAVNELTKVFDGSNYITNNNAVSMQELAEGMSIVGSTAASFDVAANETTAALGTMAASTQQSGSEVARAFRAILLNIRQVSDEEEGIDAEGLTKYEKACNALNVKLKETKNGVLQLRNPMEVLKELSVEYNKLDENDIKRTNLLSSVGGKLRSTQLDALLRNWDMYEKMLKEYDEGTGSMAVEAEKTANSWEGSLNRLSNTWTSVINNIADSSAVTSTINGLNGILSIIDKITGALGSWGTVGTVAAIALNKKLNCRLHTLTIG